MSWRVVLAGLLLTLPGCNAEEFMPDDIRDIEAMYDEIFRETKARGVDDVIRKEVLAPGSNLDESVNRGSQKEDPLTTTNKSTDDKSTTKGYDFPKPLPQKHNPIHSDKPTDEYVIRSDMMFIVITAACSVAGLVGLLLAGVCWYKLHKNVKAASDVEYPAYGVTGPTTDRAPAPGDRKLAQSAQMYHYQHQKQQMIAMEKANGEMKHDASDEESEEENEEGDYTVYECPGLAPTGEMEVRNPLFTDETPSGQSGNEKSESK
ncbi:hypothetical protein ScPMuIL_010591 [Solemya velum]